MNKQISPAILMVLAIFLYSCRTQPEVSHEAYIPDKALGSLYDAVEMQSVFADSKTFADCTPRQSPKEILELYEAEKEKPGFNLRTFVLAHFDIPAASDTLFKSNVSKGMEAHLVAQWDNLTRHPDSARQYSSLIPLPKPYVVPGGRFREIYYWDSYFTMLGLAASDRFDLIKGMLDNFAYLIDQHGHIPNGNRTYYLSRSQPPFFAAMVKLYAQYQGKEKALVYLPQLEKEYAFWMDGSDSLSASAPTHRRVIRLQHDTAKVIMNRYWDDRPEPRTESYREDVLLGQKLPAPQREKLYRNIRAACESGWDFSSRWFADGQNLSSIVTTEIIPVDLNVLMYNLEQTLAELYTLKGNPEQATSYQTKAEARKKAILHYCWNEKKGYFFDYHFTHQSQTEALTLAGMYPLWLSLASPEQAKRAAAVLQEKLLVPGGLVTTLSKTSQQWDSPNGWPPLQWVSIQGLRQYQKETLADTIAGRWLNLNKAVFGQTGKMMEKYNVTDLSIKAGGGEYPLQDGFGWTNGVALGLIREKKMKPNLDKVNR
jgi:alpha,alpha-trehalase